MAKRKSDETEFEEIVSHCKICGKKMKLVRRKGASIEGLVCQKCGKWQEE